MKRYSLHLSGLLTALILLLSGCNDFLYVKPTNYIAISSYEDVKALMGGHLAAYADEGDEAGYRSMQGPNIFFMGVSPLDRLDFFYSDDFDVVRYPDNWMVMDPTILYNALDWNQTQWPNEIWRAGYTNIGYFNTVLNELAKFPSDNQADNEIVSGEARVLRAWNFFNLVRLFSPYDRKDLGLPFNADAEKVGTYDRRRQTQDENFDFIISELESVLNYEAEPKDSYNIFYDKRLITGLLAEVHFWKAGSGAGIPEDYQKAISYAKKVLSDGVSFDVVDRRPPEYGKYGVYKNSGYSAFTAVYLDAFYRDDTTRGIPIYGGEEYYQFASDDLFSLYTPNDLRTELFFDPFFPGAIKKHLPAMEMGALQYDFITGAEMQLIIAESYARSGQDAEAEEALKAFTDTRYEVYDVDSSKPLLQRILEERRKEFCFEWGMRWFDLARLRPSWSRPAVDKEDGSFYTLEENDYRYTLPIPTQSERSQNKIEQNPGWGAQ